MGAHHLSLFIADIFHLDDGQTVFHVSITTVTIAIMVGAEIIQDCGIESLGLLGAGNLKSSSSSSFIASVCSLPSFFESFSLLKRSQEIRQRNIGRTNNSCLILMIIQLLIITGLS